MPQRVFTFHSPVNKDETIDIITKVVSEIRGKTQVDGYVITASWWLNNTTLFPHKFTFYIGDDMVRVVTGDFTSSYKKIKWEYRSMNVLKLWQEFVRFLTLMYPNLDFGLERGTFHIVAAKIMSDGIEQVFSSASVSRPSIGGAIMGGLLFGDVGAIIGGTCGKTHTTGVSKGVMSDNVLVTVRYSNGFNLEGTISKKSSVYNKILASLSVLSK